MKGFVSDKGFYLGDGSFLKESASVVNISIWVCSITPSTAEIPQQLAFLLVNMQTLRESVPILIRKIVIRLLHRIVFLPTVFKQCSLFSIKETRATYCFGGG